MGNLKFVEVSNYEDEKKQEAQFSDLKKTLKEVAVESATVFAFTWGIKCLIRFGKEALNFLNQNKG